MTTLVWLQRDLRVEDNAALAHGAAAGAVVPVFVLDEEADRRLGGAGRWWLGRSLDALQSRFADLGSPLVLRRGDTVATLMTLLQACGATQIVAAEAYDQPGCELQSALADAANAAGARFERTRGGLIRAPWDLRTGAGGGFKVFTPFLRALRAGLGECDLALTPTPRTLTPPKHAVEGDTLADWRLEPRAPDWARHFDGQPGEAVAQAALADFVEARLSTYATARDRPDLEASSRLSGPLHWGELSPRQVWRAVDTAARAKGLEQGSEKFLSEIVWREFAHHLLFHHPNLGDETYASRLRNLRWRAAPDELRSWRRGETGYPIVDAGMRQLWRTGFMPNRVRMITASFLVKDLLIDWREGERWFWDTLCDADAANNAMNWQWVAGSGPDASPFFRVFNPITQGRTFDPQGDYVRRWIPELARLNDGFIHAPWTAPPPVLVAAGVTLGRDYPSPMVDHAQARLRALDAYAAAGA